MSGPIAADNGSEDVNDFLQRIKELGGRRDQEDEERNRKLEAEILQGRKERQARRAGRSIPTLHWDHCVTTPFLLYTWLIMPVFRACQIHFPNQVLTCKYPYSISNLGGTGQYPFSVSIAKFQQRSAFRASTRHWS